MQEILSTKTTVATSGLLRHLNAPELLPPRKGYINNAEADL